MITIVDAIILLFLLMGAVVGFKRGVIRSVVTFVGTILVIILAFVLKNPLSVLMYTYLPFFKFGGSIAGVTVVNILIYEAVAFLILFLVFSAILNIIIKMTGVVETFLKFTIVLGIPSKILGAIFGLFEAFLYLFFFLFFFSHLDVTKPFIEESNWADKILTSTPGLSKAIDSTYQAFDEIYNLKDQYQGNNDKYNEEAFKIILKYNVITKDNALKLDSNGKLDIKNAKSIIEEYGKE